MRFSKQKMYVSTSKTDPIPSQMLLIVGNLSSSSTSSTGGEKQAEWYSILRQQSNNLYRPFHW